MIVNVDAKALEWYAAVYLSQDKVGMQELIDGKVDQHTDNQRRLGLPSRLIAKIFLFRLIFGGTAYAYANDPDFAEVGWSSKKWQRAIDAFYDKYEGLFRWHGNLLNEVMCSEIHQLVMPSGRTYSFEPLLKRGELTWPRTQILNYPVQGLGADLMTIGRLLLWRSVRQSPSIKLISTVHDSVVVDCPKKDVDFVCDSMYKAWEEIPAEFERQFGVPFNLPMRCEIQVGKDWGSMEDYHAN